MSKAYIVFESWSTTDDSSPIAVFLDEKKCDEFIAEKNKSWNEELRQLKECIKCRGCVDEYDNPDNGVFLLKTTCGRSDIETDRYGLYCRNDLFKYRSCSSNHYSKFEVDLKS